MSLVACKETPIENDDVLPDPFSSLKYEFGLCDSSWNFTGAPDTVDYFYSTPFNLRNLLFYNIRTKRKNANTFFGSISPYDDSFTLYTQCLLPFIDTSWTEFPYEQKGLTPKTYSILEPVFFSPFQLSSQQNPIRDTTRFEFYPLYLISQNGQKTLVIATIDFIQEMVSKIKPNTKFKYKGSSFESKCVEINFNRLLRPPVLTDWKFPRPSSDTAHNEFYLDKDNMFIADKIQTVFYYRKKLMLEIRIKHSIVTGQRYYKWRLEGVEIIE